MTTAALMLSCAALLSSWAAVYLCRKWSIDAERAAKRAQQAARLATTQPRTKKHTVIDATDRSTP